MRGEPARNVAKLSTIADNQSGAKARTRGYIQLDGLAEGTTRLPTNETRRGIRERVSLVEIRDRGYTQSAFDAACHSQMAPVTTDATRRGSLLQTVPSLEFPRLIKEFYLANIDFSCSSFVSRDCGKNETRLNTVKRSFLVSRVLEEFGCCLHEYISG